MIQLFLIWSDWALLILRVALGSLIIAHGFPKIRNLKTTIANFEGMGFRPGKLWGPLVAIVESFGGLSLIIGFLVQPVAILLTLQFVVIVIWKLKNHEKFIGGYELDMLLLAAFLVLTTTGSKFFSVDGYFGIILDGLLF